MRPPAAPHLLAALRSRMATRSRVALRTSVRAVDATSGELLWEYDPRVRDHARRMQAGWDHNRGIAYYKGRIYAATWDGRLNAIDAATGEEVWSTMTVDPLACGACQDTRGTRLPCSYVFSR